MSNIYDWFHKLLLVDKRNLAISRAVEFTSLSNNAKYHTSAHVICDILEGTLKNQ